MYKTMILLVFFVSIIYSERVLNRLALDEDTSIITDFSVDSLKYTKWFVLTDEEDIRVIFKFDDTSSAGFSGDSLHIEVGYQTGVPVFDSSENAVNECKLPDEKIILDTVLTDSLGKLELGYGSMSSDGTITRHKGQIDTSSVPGFACLPRWLDPEWDVFIRFWVRGLSDNTGSFVKTRIDVQRRRYVNMRGR